MNENVYEQRYVSIIYNENTTYILVSANELFIYDANNIDVDLVQQHLVQRLFPMTSQPYRHLVGFLIRFTTTAATYVFDNKYRLCILNSDVSMSYFLKKRQNYFYRYIKCTKMYINSFTFIIIVGQ